MLIRIQQCMRHRRESHSTKKIKKKPNERLNTSIIAYATHIHQNLNEQHHLAFLNDITVSLSIAL